MAMPARLTLHLPFQPPAAFTLEEGREYLIGRGEGCDIPCEDERVSRRHARLSFQKGCWHIQDLGSKNRTTVQGVEVQEAALPAHAWVSLGGVLAEFEVLSPERRQREAQERLRRWHSSAELSRQLAPADGVPVLLHKVLAAVLGLAGMERGFVLLTKGEDLAVAAAAGLEVPELGTPTFAGSLGAVERAARTRRPVVVTDINAHPSLASRPSVIGAGLKAMLCLPLVAGDELVGVVYADNPKPIPSLMPLDIDILESYVRHAALAVALARLEAQVTRFLQAFLAQAEGREGIAREAEALRAALARPSAPVAPPGEVAGPTLADLMASSMPERGEP